MRTACLLLLPLLAFADTEEKKEYEDDTHPRSPGTPLQVVFTPYFCTRCLAEGTITGAETVRMMRMPTEELAKTLGLEDGTWTVMESPHFKLLSTLRPSKV